MFKVNNKDTRTTLLAHAPCSSVSIVNFEHVIADWVTFLCNYHVTLLCRTVYQSNKYFLQQSLT